jgi:deoxyribose-phosphate aldolase
MAFPQTITTTYTQLAKMIDHSLLHPTMTDSDILAGLELAKKYNVATACVKPSSVPLAVRELRGTGVLVCAVVGFPHGSSTTDIKVAEADAAVRAGAHEVDVVISMGKALSGDWDYVGDEVRRVNEAVAVLGARLKVIFENDFLQDTHIVQLCRICMSCASPSSKRRLATA